MSARRSIRRLCGMAPRACLGDTVAAGRLASEADRVVRRIPRWLARAPIPLFRRGYGWLLGPRVLLEHRGRRTGRARYAVLEVVGREPGALYVVSGYGRHAQWFRNVRVAPRVRVWTGALRAAPARAAAPDSGDRPAADWVSRSAPVGGEIAEHRIGDPGAVQSRGVADGYRGSACAAAAGTGSDRGPARVTSTKGAPTGRMTSERTL